MFSRYRVKNLCFSCGSDISLNRFLLGSPCQRCEGNDELIQFALKPPQPYRGLVSRYRTVVQSEPLKVWKPWALAVLNSESITIPSFGKYRPLEFSLWMAGAFRGPVVIGIRREEFDIVLKSPLLKDRVLILQGKPTEDYIRVLSDEKEISNWDFKNYNPLIVWHLGRQPLLREAIHWGSIVINISDDYPFVFQPAFEVSKANDETSVPLPTLRIKINDLPQNPDTLKELIYMLIPYLPEDFRIQFMALSAKEDAPYPILQRLRDMLRENLLSSTVSLRLRNAKILHEDTLMIPDIKGILRILKENSSPEHRRFTRFSTDDELLRVLDRGFHLYQHTWRNPQYVYELKDISTLLVLPEGGPPIRDLGFETKITRKAAGFTVHEAIGTMGPVTILRLPNIFHIHGTTIGHNTSIVRRLQRIIKRYAKVTVISDPAFLLQGILLTSLAKPYSRAGLFKANDLYSGMFVHIQEEDLQRFLVTVLQNIREGIGVQSSIKGKLDIHLPDPRLYKVLRITKRMSSESSVKMLRLWVNGIELRYDLSHETKMTDLRLEDIVVTVGLQESTVHPPNPAITEEIIDTMLGISVKERLNALMRLYEKGYITYPYEETAIDGYFAEILRRYIKYTFGEEFVYNSNMRRGVLPTRPISHYDLRTLARIYDFQHPELLMYEFIFRRAVASMMRPVKVKMSSIQLRIKGMEKTYNFPINILEPGFNLMLPIELVKLSPVDRLTVTKLEIVKIEKPSLLTVGRLIKLLHREVPDIDPMKSLWMLKPYLNIKRTGIVIRGEYNQGID